MAMNRILFWLGRTFLLCTGLFAITALIAAAGRDFPAAVSMSAFGVSVGVFGLLLVMLSTGFDARESKSEAILFLILFWLLMPAVLCLPFKFMVPEQTFLSAYFESVSAFTTTGATRLNPDELSPVLLFWRSLLQWVGGVSVATFAVVILAAVNQTGTGVHKSMLYTVRDGKLFDRLIGIGGLVAGVYLFLSLIGFILMTLGGAPAFDALCLSLSGVSTGGLTPRAGPLQLYIPPFAATVLAILCILGAMNVAVIWDYMRLRKVVHGLRVIFNVEHRALFVILSILILIGVVFSGLGSLGDLILDGAFFVSSAGFQYQVISLDLVPPVILITFALTGGSALSTAGGVKLIRILLLFRHLGTQLSRLSHPSRVIPVTFRTRIIPDAAFLSIWMYFFAYTLAFGVGISAFGVVGLSLDDAIASAAASLSNVGPLLELTLPESGLTYAQFTNGQMSVSIVLMLLGRIEVLAALALILPNFWRQ
ncbi:MAG: potassium transporter TrkG [Litorimonas sp.]